MDRENASKAERAANTDARAQAEPSSLELQINGKARSFRAPMSLRNLLDSLGLPRTGVAVERNREIVSKAKFEETWLSSGDELEIVTLVGGG